MAIAVVIVDEGGLPVSIAPDDYGTPMIEADNGIGIAVTIIESGGLPVSGISAVIDGSPVLSVAPVISAPGGTAEIGETLSCTTGTWTNTPTSYAYQWRRGAANISGATSSTYVVVAADNAVGLRCRVTASNATGASSPANSNTLVVTDARPANTIAPVISGTNEVGQTLTSTTGTWTYAPTSYAYQWRRNGLAISGATASTYLTVLGDLGQTILCAVTASNAIGAAVTAAVSNVMTIEEAGEVTLDTPSLDLQAASDTGSSSTDNITADTTPTMTATFPSGLLEDDHIIVRDGVTEVDDHTVTAGEAGGDPIDLGLAALSHGSHSITIRQERGAAVSDWSAALVLTIDATGPSMTSATTANCAENATLSFALTAGEASTFAITGGADAAQFSISGSTLRWVANGTQDYETPLDSGANNTYVVQITPTATLSGAVGTPQSITVTVTDVVEVSSPPAVRTAGASAYNSTTVTLPSASAGDLILVMASGYGLGVLAPGPTFTSANLTFTLERYQAFECCVHWAVAGGTLTNEVITSSHTINANFSAISISGADTADPFDGTVQSVNSTTQPAITTTEANTLVFGITGDQVTGTSGWATVTSVGYTSVVSKEAATAGSYTPSFSASTGSPCATLAIRPA